MASIRRSLRALAFVLSAASGCFPSFDGLTGQPNTGREGTDASSTDGGEEDVADASGAIERRVDNEASDVDIGMIDAEAGELGEAGAACGHLPLDRAGWTARASLNGSGSYLAIDGDPATAWTTRETPKVGDWFEIDLGVRATFCELELDDDPDVLAAPVAADVTISDDHVNWSAPLVTVERIGLTTMKFDIVEAHYVRVTLTAESVRFNPNWWSIYELNVFR